MAWTSTMTAATSMAHRKRRARPATGRGRATRSRAWTTPWFPPPLQYSVTRTGHALTVTAISALTGDLFYHWYIDGAYIDTTRVNTKTFVVEDDEQIVIAARVTHDENFDVILNAPPGYPARRTLHWIGSLDAGIKKYRIIQQKEAGGYASIGEVMHDPTVWEYAFLSPRLDTNSNYDWSVVPVNAAGNDGVALALGPEKIVRTPDAPNYSITYSSGTGRVTFTEVT